MILKMISEIRMISQNVLKRGVAIVLIKISYSNVLLFMSMLTPGRFTQTI